LLRTTDDVFVTVARERKEKPKRSVLILPSPPFPPSPSPPSPSPPKKTHLVKFIPSLKLVQINASAAVSRPRYWLNVGGSV